MNEHGLTNDSARRVARHITDLGSPVETLAIAAERSLIKYGARAVEPLMAATSHEDAQVRFRSVYILGKIGDTSCYDVLVTCAQDLDPRVAQEAVIALGDLADPRAVTPLLELIAEVRLEEDEDALLASGRAVLAKLGHPTESRDKATGFSVSEESREAG